MSSSELCLSLTTPGSSQFSDNSRPPRAESPPLYVTQWVSQHQATLPEQPQPLSYESIKEEDEIRLLLLHPGQGPTQLECSIFHCRLSDEPEYQALSYMWGTAKETKSIVVNDSMSAIQPNLWAALWHIRELDALARFGDCRMLWVDALCIDQGNVQERNHQVRLMSQIYSRAFEVLVWLGEQENESHIAMCLLQDWDAWSAKSLDPREFKALERLLNRGYFRRIWIVQEICLGARVTVYCGLMSVDWENIQYLLGPQFPPGGETWSEYDKIRRSLAAQFIRHRSSAILENNRLEILLETFRYSECADLRDKIYALLGLASDCQHNEIQADYSASLAQVYEVVMLFPGLTSPFKVSQILQQMFDPSHRTNQNAIQRFEFLELASSSILGITGAWAGTVKTLGDVFKKDDASKIDLHNGYDLTNNKDRPSQNAIFHPFHLIDITRSFFLDRRELLVPLARDILHIQPHETYPIYAERKEGRRIFNFNGRLDREETASERSDREHIIRRYQNVDSVRAIAVKNRNGRYCLGLAMLEVEIGDQLCQIPDCCLSFVVRPDENDWLQVVGSAVIVGYSGSPAWGLWKGCWTKLLSFASREPWKPIMCPTGDTGDVMALFDLETVRRWTNDTTSEKATLPTCCQSKTWCIHDVGGV